MIATIVTTINGLLGVRNLFQHLWTIYSPQRQRPVCTCKTGWKVLASRGLLNCSTHPWLIIMAPESSSRHIYRFRHTTDAEIWRVHRQRVLSSVSNFLYIISFSAKVLAYQKYRCFKHWCVSWRASVYSYVALKFNLCLYHEGFRVCIQSTFPPGYSATKLQCANLNIVLEYHQHWQGYHQEQDIVNSSLGDTNYLKSKKTLAKDGQHLPSLGFVSVLCTACSVGLVLIT